MHPTQPNVSNGAGAEMNALQFALPKFDIRNGAIPTLEPMPSRSSHHHHHGQQHASINTSKARYTYPYPQPPFPIAHASISNVVAQSTNTHAHTAIEDRTQQVLQRFGIDFTENEDNVTNDNNDNKKNKKNKKTRKPRNTKNKKTKTKTASKPKNTKNTKTKSPSQKRKKRSKKETTASDGEEMVTEIVLDEGEQLETLDQEHVATENNDGPANASASTTQQRDIESLPWGHPGRVQYVDMISEAFSEKYKNEKRNLKHRTWARPKKCTECKEEYPTAEDYDTHRMLCHNEGIVMDLTCPICAHSYNEKRWLNRHMRSSHFKFECDVEDADPAASPSGKKKRKKKKETCGFRFCSSEDLDAHQAMIHGVSNTFKRGTAEDGVTLQFMKGTDVDDIVIERLSWATQDEEKGNEVNESKATKSRKRKIERLSEQDNDYIDFEMQGSPKRHKR